MEWVEMKTYIKIDFYTKWKLATYAKNAIGKNSLFD